MAPVDLTADMPTAPTWRRVADRVLAHPIVVAALTAGVLGAILLGRRSFTTDEAHAVVTARLPFADGVGETLRTDPAAAGYAALLSPVVRLGDSEWIARAPSVVAAIAAAALVALLASMLAGRLAAVVAGVALATNAGFVAVAQLARPLAIAIAAMLLATVLFVRAGRSTRLGWWVAYAVAAALLPLTHPIAASALIAHGAWLAVARGGSRPRYALPAFGFAAVEATLLLTAAAVDRWPGRGEAGLDAEQLGQSVLDAVGRNPLLVGLAVTGIVLAATGRVSGVGLPDTVLVGTLAVAPRRRCCSARRLSSPCTPGWRS